MGIVTWTPVRPSRFAIRPDLRHLYKRQPACWKVRNLLNSEIAGVGRNDLPFANRSATGYHCPIRTPLSAGGSSAQQPFLSLRARPIPDSARSQNDHTAQRCADGHGYAAFPARGEAYHSRQPLQSSNQSSATYTSVSGNGYAGQPRSSLADFTTHASHRSTASVAFTRSIAGLGEDGPAKVTIGVTPTAPGCSLRPIQEADKTWPDFVDCSRDGWRKMRGVSVTLL